MSDFAPERKGPLYRTFRFGAFELRTDTGELSRNGIRVRLQTKPLQVLQALLERQGEVVTREELRNRLWPAGTYVDFESGLNTATNRLRVALGDSAEAPRYIETLPRIGYRFICPVSEMPKLIPPPANSSPEPESETAPSIVVLPPTIPLHSNERTLDSRLLFKSSIMGLIVIVAATLVAHSHSRIHAARPDPVFRQLTFRTGMIKFARFGPIQDSVLVSLRSAHGEKHNYSLSLKDLAVQDLKTPEGTLVSVSRQGDLALATRDPIDVEQSLTVTPLLPGSSSTEVIRNAAAADWDPSGKTLALVRKDGPDSIVEFPSGHFLYRSRGWINSLRVSPRGDQVAFLEHPVRDDDGGYVTLVNQAGKSCILTSHWNSIDGLAWSGDEIWFTASKDGSARALYAVSQSGKLRQLSHGPTSLRLLDVTGKGRALVAVDDMRVSLMASLPGGDETESDLSKFDDSQVAEISTDGNFVVFTEGGEAGGQHYLTYAYDQRKHRSVLVGAGRALSLSPDGRWVLLMDARDHGSLRLAPIESGPARDIQGHGFQYQWAKFMPDGRTLLVGGAYPAAPLTICTQKIDVGPPVPIPEAPYLDVVAVARDGSHFAGVSRGSPIVRIFDLNTRSVREVSVGAPVRPIIWGQDGKDVYAVAFQNDDYNILKIDVHSGRARPWKTIVAQDLEGFLYLCGIAAAPEANAYAYSADSSLSRLYLVDGWS